MAAYSAGPQRHDQGETGAPSPLAGSGLRIGELLGLEVSDVDFLRRTIRVERQRAQSGELTPPKSKSSGRTVPVGQTVIDALAAYLKAGGRKSGPLFVNALGQPLTYRQWKPLWKPRRRWQGRGYGSRAAPLLRQCVDR